ncbi:carboxymuconolactone decarboxylase family protein [Chitinophaga polysaccharea]|uniref:carboxymuconolactone decarboxylase family protein n=1 Tax=Chitinophaga TaxID=79328 RepID=UPI001455364C|nr:MULTISPECIES: carboxymuconolactone decarboxylase family protein [Chitinophaga]NLR62629.1 carboxymuconolactone decarboxylase family protein [Chitinophaga polysaccharea]NLU91437.1 carboxymuconolactone decarboxylase family protein [Chitinophaga sp. Ak27]
MEPRINYLQKGQSALKALFGLGMYLGKSSIEQPLLHLIYFRISQVNGCAFCLDMHSKDLRAMGETEQRLYMLPAWKESPVYTARERAAFGWVEAINANEAPDEVYETARREFSEEELIDLTIAAITISGYNRINIAFRPVAGNYQPGMFNAKAN